MCAYTHIYKYTYKDIYANTHYEALLLMKIELRLSCADPATAGSRAITPAC